MAKADAPEEAGSILAVPHHEGVAWLHAILDTVPDAMIVIDEMGRIVSFSRGAEKMFGYSEDGLLMENVSVLEAHSRLILPSAKQILPASVHLSASFGSHGTAGDRETSSWPAGGSCTGPSHFGDGIDGDIVRNS